MGSDSAGATQTCALLYRIRRLINAIKGNTEPVGTVGRMVLLGLKQCRRGWLIVSAGARSTRPASFSTKWQSGFARHSASQVAWATRCRAC
ncbi:hypothetical protein THIOKS1860003 [Thiocapsa sp. KS1]|nr:hypothetical protein THIOKS1860003 [Thiocapsa sp. KS1]